MIRKSAFLVLLVTFLCAGLYAGNPVIEEFSGTKWEEVSKARLQLENMQSEAIPLLMEMLDLKVEAELVETGDLIYPGAKKFYGHGEIIEYDIDKLYIRAGWILEKITFHNFGFSYIHDRDEMLMDHLKKNFAPYLTGNYDADKLEKAGYIEQRLAISELAVIKAKEWAEDNYHDKWNRLDALKEALESKDEVRQVSALQYLRNSTAACKGLSVEAFNKHIKPAVSELSRHKTRRISEQALFIINDKDYAFIKIKEI